ncbi:hydroxymethylglutaryl-CoA lyase [Vibrio profundi]|uniref:hydroxymethylglutaryl-CoA lyase n=1 Tax=Vibrio profundi TaxID=1774960 RepID=UPI003735E2AE
MSKPKLPTAITIVEMGARDGLQNEQTVSTNTKIELINRLSKTGLNHIEAGAFVSAKWVPQMADSEQVLKGITRQSGLIYSALTPNLQGFEKALASNVNQIAIFTSASESFCKKNINCSISQSIERFVPVIEQARERNIPVRGYLSCIVDCPYEGETSNAQVAAVAKELLDLGCYEISLGDTIGTGTPLRIARMLEHVEKKMEFDKVAVHFHDTWGQALANIYQAITMGISTIDSSVGGLGGCPYAKGASGNVATEDVLYLCQGLGIHTGIDLKEIVKTAWFINQQLNRQPSSKVALAMRPDKL